MKNLSSVHDKAVLKAADKELKLKTKKIQADAKRLAPSNVGTLRNSIMAEVTETKEGLQGRVFTNNESAMFVEYGTGPAGKGTAKHIPKDAVLVYRDSSWWVNVKDFPDYHRYGFTPIEIGSETYIRTKGQKAQQFMGPAAHKHKATIGKDLMESIVNEMRKELKK